MSSSDAIELKSAGAAPGLPRSQSAYRAVLQPPPAQARVVGRDGVEKFLTQTHKKLAPEHLQRLVDEHHDEEKITYFEVHSPLPSPEIPRSLLLDHIDLFFFLALLASGLATVISTGSLTLSRTIGPMLFNSGLTPLLLSLWALLTGAKTFRVNNLLKACMSVLLLSVGAIIMVVATDEPTGDNNDNNQSEGALFEDIIGSGLFEIGALFFISKLCLLEEDQEIRIQRLEKSLSAALESPAAGLALSYFYNFVVPTAGNLRKAGEQASWKGGGDGSTAAPDLEPGQTPIEMELSRNKFAPFTLIHSQLVILIPRDLDGEHNIKTVLRDSCSAGKMRQGRPVPRPGDHTHRPMFVYFLEWSDDTRTCTGLIDIPTVVSSIYDRYEDLQQLPEKERALDIQVWKELVQFQNKLIALIRSSPITRDCVRVLSIPPLPLDADAVEDVILKQLLATDVLSEPSL